MAYRRLPSESTLPIDVGQAHATQGSYSHFAVFMKSDPPKMQFGVVTEFARTWNLPWNGRDITHWHAITP